MNVSNYLVKQFKNLNGVFRHLASDLTEAEWLARPGLGQNTLGYSVWHIPRTHDRFLNRWFCNRAEIRVNANRDAGHSFNHSASVLALH